MLSLSYNKGTHNLKFLYEVYSTIEENKGLFYKYCGTDADFFMAESYTHTLENYDESKGTLSVYIKSLARTISQNKKEDKEILVDFNGEGSRDDEENYQYIELANKAKQKQTDLSIVEYIDINEALNVLKTDYPVELLYFKKAVDKGTTYKDASKEFMLTCQKIIRQFPNMITVIQEMDLSDIKKELGLII